MNKKPFYPAILILCVLIAYFLEKKYGFQDPWIIIAISGLKQTVLRSKTDAMRSERT